MKTVKYNCDVCGVEFPPKEYSFLTGLILKVDADLKPQPIPFESHYCGECTHKILENIEKIHEQTGTSDTGTK